MAVEYDTDETTHVDLRLRAVCSPRIVVMVRRMVFVEEFAALAYENDTRVHKEF